MSTMPVDTPQMDAKDALMELECAMKDTLYRVATGRDALQSAGVVVARSAVLQSTVHHLSDVSAQLHEARERDARGESES